MVEARWERRVYVLEQIYPDVIIRPAGWWERRVHAFRLWRDKRRNEAKAAIEAEDIIKRLRARSEA